MEQQTHEEAIKKLGEMIKDIDFGMLTTIHEDGSLHSRPMSTQQVEFDGDLWFFAKADSDKAHDIAADSRVGVSFAQPNKQTYVSVSGTAELVHDRAKIDELWSPTYKAWFPEGKDDPELALIKVTVEKAEYWDSPSNPVVMIAGIVKSLATGQPAKMGENEKLDVK